MGLLGDWLRGQRMKDPVSGTAQVVACSRITQAAVASNCTMSLVVSADGIPATPVDHQCLCRQDRWPRGGQVLPVTVDRADPSRLRIEWDEVRTHEDRIAEQAEALAARMNNGEGTGNDLVDQLRAAFPGAEITVSSHQPNLSDLTGVDSVERLERLAALHRSGALTDEEFAAAKARLLG
ncbi:SHOCT domain-containing protein [Solirubrobacter soli]|uniref:SHOCT domain-containing protein n=1 Tax=Solirubrobacter soli TaxID=363832 RepID=UPI00041F6176|nr:SHOCT domain-containing protein [Solirubrobacter soli]